MTEKYMEAAIKEAKKALDQDDVPVGAVIVKNDRIIARAYNKRNKTKIVTSHAEIIAVEKACKKLNDWRLNGCTMYVTLQPCLMCESFLIESRIDKVIYGVSNKTKSDRKTFKEIFVRGNILKDDCEKLITSFFKSKRK